jgi:hypothetical protein
MCVVVATVDPETVPLDSIREAQAMEADASDAGYKDRRYFLTTS